MKNYEGLTNKEVRKRISKESSDRLGETRMMNCGEIAFIVEYNGYSDITVQFKSTGELVGSSYKEFKLGEIKSHFTPSVYGVGIVGVEEIRDKHGKTLNSYKTWHGMLRRCYSKKYQEKYPTYKDCTVCDEWKYYKDFKKWYEKNYYEIEGQKMCLDKDILAKGNKVYSPETCVLVPQSINSLFVKNNVNRGDLPIGVSYHKTGDKYRSNCNIFNVVKNKKYLKYLGLYNTPEEAFNSYKKAKEENIKQVADYYKDQIPKKLYEAMYRYKVEIDD